MVSVLRGPPQDAFLRCALRENGKNELKSATGRIGAMREIAMITGANRENAKPIERDANGDGTPGDPCPECGKASEMRQQEGNCRRIDDVIGFAVEHCVRCIGAIIGGHGLVPVFS